MDKDDFVAAVFGAALARQFPIDTDRNGRQRIWFNTKTRKYLRDDQIARPHPDILSGRLSPTEMNRLIKSVGGQPCTQVGMRQLVNDVR